MYLICSAGRVGTTMLIDWLSKYKKTNNRSDRDRLKHLIRPVERKKVERAVYLFTRKPEEQSVSLVKRFWNKQVKKLTGQNIQLSTPAGLKKYDYDVFNFEEIFRNWWFAEEVSYPIAFVNYDTLWNHLGDLVSFLKFNPQVLINFPPRRERQGTLEILEKDPELYQHVSKIYQPYKAFLKQVPDFYVKHEHR